MFEAKPICFNAADWIFLLACAKRYRGFDCHGCYIENCKKESTISSCIDFRNGCETRTVGFCAKKRRHISTIAGSCEICAVQWHSTRVSFTYTQTSKAFHWQQDTLFAFTFSTWIQPLNRLRASECLFNYRKLLKQMGFVSKSDRNPISTHETTLKMIGMAAISIKKTIFSNSIWISLNVWIR